MCGCTRRAFRAFLSWHNYFWRFSTCAGVQAYMPALVAPIAQISGSPHGHEMASNAASPLKAFSWVKKHWCDL